MEKIGYGKMAARPVGATHSALIEDVYDRILSESSLRSRYVEVGTGRLVHLVEKDGGGPLLLLHGSGSSAAFFLPLLKQLEGISAVAPDLPGRGLSDPVDFRRKRYRETAVGWLDQLVDALGLDTTTLLGHSAGGVWALWYALAHPDRVRRLVLIGPPALPKTRPPLPYRLIATPGVGKLISRLNPPTPRSTLQLARFMGEETTLAAHPDLIDLLVANGRDPMAAASSRTEVRMLISPFALLSRSGFRRRTRVRTEELHRLAMPTLLVWGEREPLGSVAVARAVAEMIPDARLEVLPAGHVPWLGHSSRTAAMVADFVKS